MLRTLLAVGLITANMMLPARADQMEPLADYFASFNSCYGRVYTPGHMAKQPYQQVTEIALSHFTYRQELLGAPNAFQPYPDMPRLVAVLDLRVREMETVMAGDVMVSLKASAICEPEGQRLRCGIEGDGGRFFIEPAKDKWRLRLRLAGALHFETMDGFYTLNPEPQDDVFLLSPLPGSHCQTPPRQ